MQPELPWNVAGIAPEAREAARASARREGLSVGEWLTREILRDLAAADAPAQDFWMPASNGHRHGAEHPSSSFDEQMKGLARRLEQTERRVSDNTLATSRTTSDLNGAQRAQTHALSQLTTHVAGLTERLARLERNSTPGTSKEAVRALHQGLSRLTDKIAETADRSTAQVAQLATNIESVAGRLAETRSEGLHSWRTVEDRVAALAAEFFSLREVRNHADNHSHELEQRVAAAEHSIGRLEAEQKTIPAGGAEILPQSAPLTQISESLETLSHRFAATEAQLFGSLARLEDQMTNIDAQHGLLATTGRLQAIEHALTDITARIERSERDRAGASDALEEDLRNLTLRVDAAERRHKEAIAELGAAVKETSGRLGNGASDAAAPIQPSRVPSFDLPPFADARAENSLRPAAAESPLEQPASPVPAPPFVAPPPFGADAFASSAARSAGSAGVESFLAAARRTARTTSRAGQEAHGTLFSWVARPSPANSNRGERTRFILLAGIGLLIIAAITAGLVLSQNLNTPPPPRPAPQLTASRLQHPPSPAALPQTTLSRSAAAARRSAAPTTAGTGPRPNPARVRSARAAHTHPAPTQVQTTAPSATAAAAPSTAAQTTAQSSPQDRLAALASAGNAKAQELLGLQYLDGEGVPVNEAEAAKWLERAALQGEPVAAYRLGTLYERGHGVAAEPAKAVQWYAVAARAGNRKAMHNLAVAYAQGTGVQKDLTLAAQWFAHAADLGLADSQFNLGVLYERGMGVPQNLIDAYKWYAVAAAQGDSESKARIDALASQISAVDKAAAEKAAGDFHPAPLARAANSPPDMAMLLGG